MTQAARCAVVLFLVWSSAPGAEAGDPVARLPAGAQVVAFFDLDAWSSSAAVQAVDAVALGESLGVDTSLFGGIGDEGQFHRFAFGGFPAADGKDMHLAVIVDGTWDQAALIKRMLEDGAVEIAVAGQTSYRLPKDEDGDDFVVSFLGDGRLAVSDWDLAESVRKGGGPLSSSLTREVAALPQQLSAWVLVEDPLAASTATGVQPGAAAGLAGGVRSLAVWARAAEIVEVGASALARDTQQATQLGAMLQLGLLGLSSQGGGEWTDVLSTLRFDTQGERLSLALKLGPDQVARLMGQASAASETPR